jgi:hypothetical protein
MRINRNIVKILFAIAGFAFFTACQSSASKSSEGGATPTEAYKSLFAAVKSKNTEAIKSNLSKTTIEFADGIAGMQKKTPEEMYKNGLIPSTLSETLPPLRNERVKGNMGAIEARTPDGTWEDVPFMMEDGRWKLAWGEQFKGTYQKPAPSQAETEANNNVPQMLPGTDLSNTNALPKLLPGPKLPPANKPEKK